MTQAIALYFDGGIIFRNVRPLEMILDECVSKGIEHIHVNPQEMKYGTWDLVLVFNNKETREQYQAGEVQYTPSWAPGTRKEKQRINPLKAAKRAARRR
ncbi:MAG: hypothetical protein CSA32_03985 [Desulfobulbus propionicus]|nr:MAG: hypothetical protein CSA32_03985 [Desulfobulbus propionicus]